MIHIKRHDLPSYLILSCFLFLTEIIFCYTLSLLYTDTAFMLVSSMQQVPRLFYSKGKREQGALF